MSDDTDSGPEIHRLYYKCSKCGKVNSQPYVPGFGEPYLDCPFCGGLIEFEPNCWTCGEEDKVLGCSDCHSFDKYRQKVKT